MEFGVLGPVQVRNGGAALPVGTRKRQCVLAGLAVNAGRVVELHELIDELWPHGPPASAAANVRGYVGSLRRMLASAEARTDRLVRHGTGYVLNAEPDELDLLVYSGTVAAGLEALRLREPKAAAARLGEALALWRGPMAAGLPRGPLLAARCTAIEDDRLTMTETLAEIHLDLDEPAEAIALLRPHVRENPLRERGQLALMRAHHRLGDAPAALAVFAAARTALSERLGIEPGQDLQRLHRVVLHREPDPSTAPPPIAAVAAPPDRQAPAQLPLDVYGFAGRRDHLDRLNRILAAASAQPTAVIISAVSGTAGVGKTATAVHWAHHVREEFPDGQLYVNLRGFDPSGVPMEPAEAVRGFLDALGVPPQRIPTDLDARAGLYRSLVATRRMLVLLDNARDAEQVRPLLPGSPGCLVLVTSRNRLTGLVAAEGAHPVLLDVLSLEEARQLLTHRLGSSRVAAEPEAVDEIIVACARLPLALTVAAAHAIARLQLPLAALAAELQDARARLDALDGGDQATDLRAVFASSYRALPSTAARLFRLLGLHPGPDIDLNAAASLTGLPVVDARTALAELASAHLVSETASDRYISHDLLRAYARELAHIRDTANDRYDATQRLFDHYLHTATIATNVLWPAERHLRPRLSAPTTPPLMLADPAAASAWLGNERINVIAAIDHAVTGGFSSHATRLATIIDRYLYTAGHFADAVAVHTHAHRAARRITDRTAEAHALTNLGNAYWAQGLLEEAADHVQQAVSLFRRIGDRPGEGRALTNLSGIQYRMGAYASASDQAQQALSLFRETGDRLGEGHALVNLGCAHRRLGCYRLAVDTLQQALDLYCEVGYGQGEAFAVGSLGVVYSMKGQYDVALGHLRRALAVFRDLGNRSGEAYVVNDLGDAYHGLGQYRLAIDHHRQALTIFREICDAAGEAQTRNGLGEALLANGEPDQATIHYAAALTLAVQAGDRDEQARAHSGLANCCHVTGDLDRARHHYVKALTIYTDLDVPEADQIRLRLAALNR